MKSADEFKDQSEYYQWLRAIPHIEQDYCGFHITSSHIVTYEIKEWLCWVVKNILVVTDKNSIKTEDVLIRIAVSTLEKLHLKPTNEQQLIDSFLEVVRYRRILWIKYCIEYNIYNLPF